MTTIHEPASRRLHRQSFRPEAAATSTVRPGSTVVEFRNAFQLINEAMSRARMRRPHEVRTSEAYRPARRISMNARREQMRMLGE